MNFRFDETIARDYKSNSQKVRVMSEKWVSQNVYCPVCGNTHILNMENNLPVADFQCDYCGEIFELKSKKGNLGNKIADGAYDTMIDRITSISNPDLFVMQYSENLEVLNLSIIPKFFFIPAIIEKRKPLSATSRRAGWVGCNILYSEIPQQGRITIIKNQTFYDKTEVVDRYNKIKKLQNNSMEQRGWLFDIMNCINNIPCNDFSLSDVYNFVEILQQKHLNNHHIEAKIRQQLQLLRDKGFIEFAERGKYKKLIL